MAEIKHTLDGSNEDASKKLEQMIVEESEKRNKNED